MEKIRKFWWLEIIRGVILIIIGVMAFRNPIGAMVGLAFYIGLSMLFIGIAHIFMAIAVRNVYENWGWRLAGGIIEILLAFILLSNPLITASTLPFLVGFWIIIYGAMALVNSFSTKKEGGSNWWLGTLIGLLTIVTGFFITNNALAGIFTITYLIGVGFLSAGVLSISIGLRLKS